LAEWYEESVIDGGADASGFVWPGVDGGPMGAGSPSQLLRRALCRAGLVDADERPLVTFHGLRHTAGSLCLSKDVSLIVVSRQLGHADPQITAKVYAHLLRDEQLDEAAEVFEQPEPSEKLRDELREDA
jgi:integrase